MIAGRGLNLGGEIRQLPLLVPNSGGVGLRLTMNATSVCLVHTVSTLWPDCTVKG